MKFNTYPLQLRGGGERQELHLSTLIIGFCRLNRRQAAQSMEVCDETLTFNTKLKNNTLILSPLPLGNENCYNGVEV